MEQLYWHKGSDEILGHVTVYKYGKLYSPCPYTKKVVGLKQKSQSCDRSGLISEIHRLLFLHRTRSDRTCIRDTKSQCPYRLHLDLQNAIRLCYELQIGESKLYPVGDVLQELINCSGNSKSLFGLLLRNDALSHMKSTEILYPSHHGSENKKAFEYYLGHAVTMRDETFEWNNGRPLDIVNQEIEPNLGITPLVAAVQIRDPEIVLTLLRYGADPFLKIENSESERVLDPLEILFDDLNGLYLFKKTGFSESTKTKLGLEEAKGLKCLSYIRRAVLDIPVSFSRHIVTCSEEDEDNDGKCDQNLRKVKKSYSIQPGMAEELFDIKIFLPTVSLQHACRCTIRQQLKLNRVRCSSSLPKMISALPLPNLLKGYVDLQMD